MLQNARVTAFTISELLRENQQGGEGVKLPSPTQIRVHICCSARLSRFALESVQTKIGKDLLSLKEVTTNVICGDTSYYVCPT